MMFEEISHYCLSKAGTTLDYPYGPATSMYKVGGKKFARLSAVDDITKFDLKCEPTLNPNFHVQTYMHMVPCDVSGPELEVQRKIDHAYDLIFRSLPKKLQNRLIKESHLRYLFPDVSYEPMRISDGDEYYPNGIFIFNVSRILRYIAENPVWCLCESVRVKDYRQPNPRLDYEFLPQADASNPILLAEISPGCFNLIDGHHRIEKAYLDGLELISAYKLEAKPQSFHYRTEGI